MSETKDPREKLGTYASIGSSPAAPPEIVNLADDPHETDGETRSWYMRGQNFVLGFTEAGPGATFVRTGQVDEYMFLLEHEGTDAQITWNGETTEVPGYSLVIIPPGDSTVVLPKGGRVTRLYTSRSEDLVAKCPNAANYATPKPHCAPLVNWPDPVDGWKVRSYSLEVQPPPGGFARMYRCTTFMINVFNVMMGPRDTAKLSPHSHDDFEQCSLQLRGDWEHSLRWTWGADLAAWRPDEHHTFSAPAAMVIPASVVHSSRGLSEGENQLVDIFCPPRVDFSKMEGWVLNADEYPMPEGV